ncbi:hypothetical protein M407DRAFT_17240 [Tulasnella calospora MUT 4182]|uniref:BZIP domain-containing protein n=1 Tax=Tulasnella calospora MUT 4182 TaxID=1051891 RepID=A0A0C3QM47_9AGAM|nr:hypothetical protein M407DRAFT_17240 [Tulasnella calospora MUT 4182]
MATTVAPSVSPSPSTLSSPSSPATPSHAPSSPSVSVHQNDHQPHHSKLDHQPKSHSPPKKSDDLPMNAADDPKDAASNNEASKNGVAGAGLAVTNAPVRPPPRPFRRANLSLEQNPFEVSFSQSSTSGVQPGSPRTKSNNSNAGSNVNGNSNTTSENDDPNNHSRNPSDAGANAGGQKTSPKPTLPPISAIDEPSREGGPSFPWGFSAVLNDNTGSLRSGPLSPAMLPGPRQDGSTATAAGGAGGHGTSHGYFDAPSLTFRTGLTPGIGRTGLTPLVGGPASFPPPSPNTAAFLAMVTNPGGATGQQVSQLTGGATITPNTLSALTGTLMQHVNATSGADSASNAANGAGNPSTAGQAQNGPAAAGGPGNQAGAHPIAVSHTFGAQNPVVNGAYSQTGASEPGGFRPPMDSYSGAAQNAAAAAANGLFLLSQAHQELTKREEQQQAQAAAQAEAAAAAANNARGPSSRRGSTMASTASTSNNTAAGNGHNKRKSGDATAPAQAPRPSGKRARGSTASSTAAATSPTHPTRQSSRRKKTAEVSVSFDQLEMDSPEQDDMSVDEDDIENMLTEGMAPTALGGGPGRAGSKKFETEEEKRRNFLERNRQAALKCRQRKKAWLTQLQQQVEYLKTENERLQGTIVSMRDEVTRLSAVVVAHRACGLGGVVVPGYAAASIDPHHGGHHGPHSDRTASPSSPVVGVAPVSVPVSVPPPSQQSAASAQASQGYGY